MPTGLILVAAFAIQAAGLEIAAKSLERSPMVNLQDCPAGENTVRGVIRPVENNEFATIGVEVKVPAGFAGAVPKPVLYDAEDKSYKTAQSFGELKPSSTYSCSFSFRVPKGTKLSRIAIGESSLDLSAIEK